MKSSTTTSCWNVFLATIAAVGVAHVTATAVDEQRYDILDTILRHNSRDSNSGMTGGHNEYPHDDDDDYDGCLSILLYDHEDCSGPVRKLVHAPIMTEPKCLEFDGGHFLDSGSAIMYCDVASNTFHEEIYILDRQCDDDCWIYKLLPFLKRHLELNADECYQGAKLNACEKGYCDPDGFDDDIYDDDSVPPPSPTSPQLAGIDATVQAN